METATTASQNIVSALTTNITPEKISTVFVDALPWIGGMVVVALAIYEVRKMTKGASKAKVRF